MAFDFVQCRQNVSRLVLNDGDFDIAGQQISAARQAALDALDNPHGVFARLPLHLQHDRRLAIKSG
jgi:hypothetical protein